VPQNSIQVREHVDRRNSEHLEPVLAEISVPFRVPIGLIATIVGLAVNFQHKCRFMAEEVDDVGTRGLLAAKL
jgi:hypothetical protein